MQSRQESIHIIDDDLSIIKVLKHMLRKKGYIISYSLDGTQALKHLENNLPDLILLDILMPGPDGYEVCRQIKQNEQWAQIPVIFITSSHDTDELIKGFNSGAVDFISKPANPPELIARVHTHLELKKARDMIQQKNIALEDEIKNRKQAEEKFRALSETTFEAVVFLEKNRIVEYNKAALALFGSKISNTDKNISIYSFTDKNGATVLKKIIQTKGVNGPWEMTFFKEDNQPFFGLVQYQTLKYKGSDVNVLTIRDVTRQKEMDKEIFSAILEAEENERKRFSRDMHDGLGALLSTLKIYVNLLQKQNKSEEEKQLLLEEMKDTISKAVESARTIANNIMPSVLMDHGLIKALRSFTDALNKTGAITIRFHYPEIPLTIDRNTEGHFYRIILELINNTLKHADATAIEIEIMMKNNLVKLYYTDNGKGFDFEKVYASGNTSQGLKNILSRVNFLNGEGLFQTLPGEGLSFQLELPQV